MYRNDKIRPLSVHPHTSRFPLGDFSSNIQITNSTIAGNTSHLISSNVALNNIELTLTNIEGSVSTSAKQDTTHFLMGLLATKSEQANQGTSLTNIDNTTSNIEGKILKSNVISSDGTTSTQTVQICGTNDGTNLRTVKTDGNGSLIVDVSQDGIITSDGVTEEQRVMICGSNDGTNLRTVSTYDTGEIRTVIHGEDAGGDIHPLVVSNSGTLITEIEHTWQTETLENATPLAGGGTALTTGTYDVGNGISHEYNAAVFFITNSANMSIDVQPQNSYDGTNWFVSAAGVSVTTTQNKSYMCQNECFKLGQPRYMRLRIVNNGVSSTNITVLVGAYA